MALHGDRSVLDHRRQIPRQHGAGVDGEVGDRALDGQAAVVDRVDVFGVGVAEQHFVAGADHVRADVPPMAPAPMIVSCTVIPP